MSTPPNSLLANAVKRYEEGDLRRAEALAQKLLRQPANAADALNLLGMIRIAENRNDEAVRLIALASERSPGRPEFVARLGQAQMASGDFAGAAASFRKQLAIDGKDRIAHYNLGRAFFCQGQLQQALAGFARAAEIDAGFAQAHYNVGVVCQRLRDYAAAEAAYRRTLAIDPAYRAALSNLAVVLRHQEDKLQPALQAALLAVEAAPDDADNWNNLGLISRDLGDPGAAGECIGRALSLAAKAEYLQNMGTLLLDARRIDEAIAYFGKAIAADPANADAHMNLGFAHLLRGNFALGWQEYEWRLRRPESFGNHPDFAQAQWRGEDIAGQRLLVCAEQGLGDTLHFVRYAPTLAACGATLTVEVQAPLLRLLANSFAGIDFIATGDARPAVDCWTPLLSLPGLLGKPAADSPEEVPYLRADAGDVARFAAIVGERRRPRVGLVWSGAPRRHDVEANRVDRRRSVHLRAMSPLLELSGIDFYSVQKGPAAAQLGEVDSARRVIDVTAQVDDFADTAALLHNLDLLITVDTSMAHLAGGLGLPVWMLSRFDGCWRWLVDGSSTIWYPSMKIYRQQTAGDWSGVIAQLQRDLAALAGTPC